MRYNPEQLDEDLDGLGNECDDDIDNDSIDNFNDNCKLIYNPFQEDTDGDGKGNKCQRDEDGDGIVIFLSYISNQNDSLLFIKHWNYDLFINIFPLFLGQ